MELRRDGQLDGGSNAAVEVENLVPVTVASLNEESIRDHSTVDTDTAHSERTTCLSPTDHHGASLNKLDMRMLIMRERFRKLEFLGESESPLDGMTGTQYTRRMLSFDAPFLSLTASYSADH